jgi:hypothetical protein
MSISLQELQDKLERLERENAELKADHAYGGLSPAGLRVEFRNLSENDLFVVGLDLDGIHDLNNALGSYEATDQIIRSAFTDFDFRSDDLIINNLVIFGRHKSGDEIAFIIRGNPEGFIHRLYVALEKHGLSGIADFEQIQNRDLQTALVKVFDKVLAAKNLRGKVSR